MRSAHEASLERWRTVGLISLGICFFIDFGMLGAVSFQVGRPLGSLAVFMMLGTLLGIHALVERNWVTASILLAVAGIANAVVVIGIFAAAASVRIWAKAEVLWRGARHSQG